MITQRFFAFLRAINVGGHTVKMDLLRRQFESIGLTGVETFIASGNVIFETDDPDTAALENRIENALQRELGFPVATFIRTPSKVSQIASCQPFPSKVFETAAAFNVAFLKAPVSSTAASKLAEMENEIDRFSTVDTELYWLCQVRQSESKFSNAVLERVIGQPSTIRNVSTVKKMVEKNGQD